MVKNGKIQSVNDERFGDAEKNGKLIVTEAMHRVLENWQYPEREID